MQIIKLLNEIKNGNLTYTSLSNKNKVRVMSIMEGRIQDDMKMLPFIKDKKFIQEWLDYYEIKNYTIQDDGTVDVDGNVYIHGRKLTDIMVKFGKVTGDFIIIKTELSNMNNLPTDCPHIVLDDNNIRTIKNIPYNCWDLSLNDNKIDFMPNLQEYDNLQILHLAHNKIEKISPTHPNLLVFYIDNNKLTNLKNYPKKLDLSNAGIVSSIRNNPLVSLKNLPVDFNDFVTFNNICSEFPHIKPSSYIDDADKLLLSLTTQKYVTKKDIELLTDYISYIETGEWGNYNKTIHTLYNYTKYPKDYRYSAMGKAIATSHEINISNTRA